MRGSADLVHRLIPPGGGHGGGGVSGLNDVVNDSSARKRLKGSHQWYSSVTPSVLVARRFSLRPSHSVQIGLAPCARDRHSWLDSKHQRGACSVGQYELDVKPVTERK